ncbi:DUF45 domain-containing protein [Candidatus Uhrbacteria bacterium]|nr:DUF45 domain-containing protein [Candidatus Uhrbacteria bacterium]
MWQFSVDGKPVLCRARVSARARHVRGMVHADGRVELVLPRRFRLSEDDLHRLFAQHRPWFEQAIRRLRRVPRQALTHGEESMRVVRQRTETMVRAYLAELAHRVRFSVHEIRVRPYKTRWGCCRLGGRLSFHYKLCLLPRRLAQYVVIHEVCHLFHPNHSPRFWAEVRKLCPDAEECRRALRTYVP